MNKGYYIHSISKGNHLEEKQSITAQSVAKKSLEINQNSHVISDIRERKLNRVNSLSALINESSSISRRIIHDKKALYSFEDEDDPKPKTAKKVLEFNGVFGLVWGIVSLFLYPLLFGIIAVALSALSIYKIKKNPNKYKGLGFAIAGFILGIISIIVGLVLILGA